MNQIESQFNQAKNAVEFSPARQQALRQNLMTYMAANPVAVPTNQHSSSWSIFRLRILFARPVSYVTAFVGLMVVAGAGTALASNNALPGSSLYTIKTEVNEPIRAALTFNANARADYQAQLATRRVAEANTLAAQGKLDSQTQDQLAENFDSHARKVQDRVQQLQTEHNDSGASSLATNFAATVGAQEHVFVRISSKNEDSFINHISDKVNAVAKVSATSSAVVNINNADNEIVSTSDAVKNDTKVRTKAKAQLDDAKNLLDQAQIKLKSRDYTGASELSNRALETARKARIIMDSNPSDNNQSGNGEFDHSSSESHHDNSVDGQLKVRLPLK